MRGNMRLDNKGKYVLHILGVICVYSLLFGLCLLGVRDFEGQPDERQELLCMISGFPLTDLPLDGKAAMIKWMLGLSVLFILAGREVYDRQNNLKYVAVIRYGSYRRFYRCLMNRTIAHVLSCGTVGTLTVYLLYRFWGNGQVGGREFLKMSVFYLLQVLLLCLLQTMCMILSGGYTAGVILLAAWFVMAVCGHLIMTSGWIWLPVNWGMYLRREEMVSGGVPETVCYMQAGVCILLWLGVPIVIKRKK